MDSLATASNFGPASPSRIEFFRLPAPGLRDPHFGLSRGWYYKAAALGEIKMVAIRRRGAIRGVRLVVHDSVVEYIKRCSAEQEKPAPRVAEQGRLPLSI